MPAKNLIVDDDGALVPYVSPDRARWYLIEEEKLIDLLWDMSLRRIGPDRLMVSIWADAVHIGWDELEEVDEDEFPEIIVLTENQPSP